MYIYNYICLRRRWWAGICRLLCTGTGTHITSTQRSRSPTEMTLPVFGRISFMIASCVSESPSAQQSWTTCTEKSKSAALRAVDSTTLDEEKPPIMTLSVPFARSTAFSSDPALDDHSLASNSRAEKFRDNIVCRVGLLQHLVAFDVAEQFVAWMDLWVAVSEADLCVDDMPVVLSGNRTQLEGVANQTFPIRKLREKGRLVVAEQDGSGRCVADFGIHGF